MSLNQHVGPTAPASLNGVSTLQISLPKAAKVTIQAALFTNPNGLVHWRVDVSPSLTATALTTAEGFLTHGGAQELDLNPSAQMYLYVFTTDTAGTALTCGTADRVDMWATSA